MMHNQKWAPLKWAPLKQVVTVVMGIASKQG
jgi:hypothetical protein